jgi:hypothetical protein
MPERVRDIKRDIETGLDFRGMREGRAEVFAYARRCGYKAPGMLVLEWSREFNRTHQSGWILSGARAEDAGRYRRITTAGRGDESMELVDHWADRWASDQREDRRSDLDDWSDWGGR